MLHLEGWQIKENGYCRARNLGEMTACEALVRGRKGVADFGKHETNNLAKDISTSRERTNLWSRQRKKQ